jgi:hypothetical protein
MILLGNKISNIVLSLIIILSSLNCGLDIYDPSKSKAKGTKDEDGGQPPCQETMEKLNQFSVVAQEETKKFDEWVHSSKSVLGIEEKEERDPSLVEKISTPILSGGKKVETAMGVMKASAKVAGYFGVPGASLVADLTSYNSAIKTVRRLIEQAQPQNIYDKLAVAQEYLLGFKAKTIGMSQSEKEAALAKLNNFTSSLLEAQKRTAEIEKLNNMLESLYKENPPQPNEANFIKFFVKNRYLEQSSNLEIIFQMSTSLLLSAGVIGKSLEPYKSDGDIGSGLEELQRMTEFVNGLPALSGQLDKKIQEL